MNACPVALAEKATLINFVVESLGTFDDGGTSVFAAWEVVNQFSGELKWSDVDECYSVTDYDIGMARRAAESWVSGNAQHQHRHTEGVGVCCKVTRRLTADRQNEPGTHNNRVNTGTVSEQRASANRCLSINESRNTEAGGAAPQRPRTSAAETASTIRAAICGAADLLTETAKI